jgi:hypothetical protein
MATAAHADDRTLVHAEIDPLPFLNHGYGAQLGIRYHDVRVAIASFSLHVPDPITQLGDNDGFDQRVRPSGALYGLYYFENGFAVGGSIRYLRIRYQHDDVLGEEAHVSEVSPEAIVAYQWHPFDNGFYVQPWFALGVTLWRDGDATVGGHTYEELPVSPFFTVNIGYEHAL